MKNYCGKDCESCNVRERDHCAGCAAISDNGSCEIAKCCRDKAHESCSTCTQNSYCPTFKTAFTMPAERRKQAQAKNEAEKRMSEHARILVKWLTPLFWLLIVSEVVGMLNNDNLLATAPYLHISIYAAVTVCGLLHGYFLWNARSVSDRYRIAAGFTIASSLLNGIVGITGIAAFTDNNQVPFIVGLPSAVMGCIGLYQEYNAHSDALVGADNELSENWERLWKWTIGALAGVLLSVPLTALLGGIGILFAIVCIVASVVFHIKSLLYLWRTVQIFKWVVDKTAD